MSREKKLIRWINFPANAVPGMAGPGFAETTNVTTGTSNTAVTNGQVAQSGKPRKEVDPVDQFPGERPAKDGRAGVKMLSKCAATDGLQAVCFGQVAQSGELEPEIDPVDQFPSERPARGGRAGVKMLSKCAATDGL
ncbi:MAG: hypothetical protein ACE1Z4_12325, partial [Gammaproteobacteria bacterium]